MCAQQGPVRPWGQDQGELQHLVSGRARLTWSRAPGGERVLGRRPASTGPRAPAGRALARMGVLDSAAGLARARRRRARGAVHAAPQGL